MLENVLRPHRRAAAAAPAEPWLRGERSPEAAAEAWRALAGLPLHFLRSRTPSLAVVGIVSVALVLRVRTSTSPCWLAFPVLVAGASVVVAYGVFLRFFAIELIVRPVLADVARDLPDGTALNEPALSLRWRLLVALPAVNIITGVVVAGLAGAGRRASSDLGLGVLVAIGVAFTISLELTLLLLALDPRAARRPARGTARVAAGDFSARVPVLATDETGQLGRLVQRRMVAGPAGARAPARGVRHLRRPRAWPSACCSEGDVLEGEEVEVTVLFLDIRDFTALRRARRARARSSRASTSSTSSSCPCSCATAATRTSSSATACWPSSARPSGCPTTPTARSPPRSRSPGVVDERYGGELRIGIGVNSGAGAGGHDRRRRAPRVHRHRRRGQHRLARRGGHARDGRQRARHRRDAAGCCARPRRLRRAPGDGAARQERARRAVRAAPTAGADRRRAAEVPLEPTADRVSP